MKYFFHCIGEGRLYQDQGGEEFDTVKDALSHAKLIATELADGGGFNGLSVLVTDENGMEVGQILISTKLQGG